MRGSGLRLAIVKMIVDLMMSRVSEVESQARKGSALLIILEMPYTEENKIIDTDKKQDFFKLLDCEITLLVAEDNDLN